MEEFASLVTAQNMSTSLTIPGTRKIHGFVLSTTNTSGTLIYTVDVNDLAGNNLLCTAAIDLENSRVFKSSFLADKGLQISIQATFGSASDVFVTVFHSQDGA